MIYSCPNCDRFFLSRSDFDKHTAGTVTLTVDDQPHGEPLIPTACLSDDRLKLRGAVTLDRTGTFWVFPRPASL